ncbi:MAG: HK97 family phage prohead protease [Candidatus Obscuribacterales bacterium]|nr:HK97 family phage prohead protease [Candidatus Obscuribacterales bacterium]
MLYDIRGTMNRMKSAEVGEGEKKKIAGDFIVYDSLSEPIYDWYKEEMKPGASKRSLKGEHGRDDIAGLFDHQSGKVLGSTRAGTMKLKETKTSLYGEIEPPDTSYGRDLMVSLERGDISSASFGFMYVTTKWRLEDNWDVLEVHDMDLIEVTVCKFPAYRATQIGIRSHLVNCKDVEQEALPALCRAYNRLENNLDMTQDDKSNILQYRTLLTRLLPEASDTVLRRLNKSAKVERNMTPAMTLDYIDVLL